MTNLSGELFGSDPEELLVFFVVLLLGKHHVKSPTLFELHGLFFVLGNNITMQI